MKVEKLIRRTTKSNLSYNTRGASIVEVLIVLFINMVLLALLVKMYGYLLFSTILQQQQSQLTQIMQGAIWGMTKELQRVNIKEWGVASINPLVDIDWGATSVRAKDKSCLFLIYTEIGNKKYIIHFAFGYVNNSNTVQFDRKEYIGLTPKCRGGESIFDTDEIEIIHFTVNDNYRPLLQIELHACYKKSKTICLQQRKSIMLFN